MIKRSLLILALMLCVTNMGIALDIEVESGDHLIVNGGGPLTVGDIYIEGYTDDASLTFDSSSAITTVTGDVDIHGSSSHTGSLIIDDGDVTVRGDTTIRENGELVVQGNGKFNAGDVTLQRANNLTTPKLIVEGNAEVSLGDVRGTGAVFVSGSSSLEVDSFTLLINDETALSITDSASFKATGNNSLRYGTMVVNTSGAVRLGNLDIIEGELRITDSADLDGNITASNSTIAIAGTVTFGSSATPTGSIVNNGGELTVASGADLTIGSITLASGEYGYASVDGSITANTVRVHGGEVEIFDTVTANSLFEITGGMIHVDTGGEIVGNLAISGDSDLVFYNGASYSGGDIAMTGGALIAYAGTDIDAGEIRMSDGYLALYSDTASATSLSVSGGLLNIMPGGDLAVSGTGSFSGSGQLNLMEATVSFGGNVTFNSGSELNVLMDSNMNMAGHTLTIRDGATMDAQLGSLDLDGNLALQGTYWAGWDYANDDAHRANVTGTLTIDETTANIMISENLRNEAMDRGFSNPVSVLSFGYTDRDLEITSNNLTFEYFFQVNSQDGNIYLTGIGYLDDSERLKGLYERWNANPRVQGKAYDLIRPDFANAILRGADIYYGIKPYDVIRDNLSTSGLFNAGALEALLNPYAYADYDALMLYNGSTLGQANRAVLETNGQFMRMLGKRNSFVRNEYMAGAGQTIGGLSSDAALASPYPSQDYDCILPNRVWASYFYSGQNASSGKGFAGYKYRPQGVLVGYDYLTRDNITIGGSLAYYGGRYKDGSALAHDSNIDNYGVAMYGSYNHCTGLFVTGAIGYVYSDNDLRDYRVLNEIGGWNSADFHTNSLMMTLNVGYDWEPVEDLTISPSIGFAYQKANSSSHNQRFRAGDNSAAATTLQASAVKNHSTTIPIEIGVSYDFYGEEEGVLTLGASIGYAYELHNRGASGSVTYGGLSMIDPVSIVSRRPGRNIMTVGLNGKYAWRNWEFSAGYDYFGRRDYNAHTLNASVGINF